MADTLEKRADRAEDEGNVPVFTVTKNGAILKNIFVINQPRSPPSTLLSSNPEPVGSAKIEDKINQEMEEILIVGRHPDCDIMLTHPSISRFHLQIHSNPSAQKLSLIDLSSVHGTWVSEKRIEPGVRVELKEGDTIRVGGSTRVYRLHWIPLSRAYDIENPFVSQMDLSMEKEREEENAVVVAEIAAETNQNDGSLICQNKCIEEKDLSVEETEGNGSEYQIMEEGNSVPDESENFQSLDLIFDDTNSLLADENSEITLNKEVISAPLMHKWDSVLDETGSVSPSREILSPRKQPAVDVVLEPQNQQFDMNNQSSVQSVPELIFEKQSLSSRENKDADLLTSLDSSELAKEMATKAAENEIPTPEWNEQTRGNPLSVLLVTEPVNPSSLEEEFVLEVKTTQLREENKKQGQQFALEQTSESDKKGNFVVNGNLNFLGSINNAEKLEEAVKSQSSTSKGQRKIRTQYSAPLAAESMSSSLPVEEVPDAVESKEGQTPQSHATAAALSEIQNLEGSMLRSEKKSSKRCIRYRRGKPAPVLQIQTSRTKEKMRGGNNGEVELPTQGDLFSKLEIEEEIYTPDKENLTPRTRELKFLKEIGKLEEIKSSSKAYQPLSSKAAFSPTTQQEEDLAFSDQENQTPFKFLEHRRKAEENKHSTKAYRLLSSKAAFCPSIQLEPEDMNASSEYENKTPLKFSKKKGRLEEIQHSPKGCQPFSLKKGLSPSIQHSPKGCQPFSLKKGLSPSIQLEEEINATSDKENKTPKLLREQKPAKYSSRKQASEQEAVTVINATSDKKRTERVPFQCLLLNSAEKREPDIAASSYRSNCSQPMEKRVTCLSSKKYVGEGKRRWTIIVDTTTLLDKKSRKSLQLLQGLKGTELVVPRMVIRELDCLKRHGSFFRRTTEVSDVLEWIEECMVKTKWWIHVQRSLEDAKPIAPTPPASPQSCFSNEGFSGWTTSSVPFSAHGMVEIVSPTAEDHILDCALHYRKMKSDRKLVLVSNDITLKIKAMAEGVICETAQEFRESLVNPFSERFMWAESSPRGLTWSHLDDVVLRENYNRYPANKSLKGEGAKGLKLILLHNSRYGLT